MSKPLTTIGKWSQTTRTALRLFSAFLAHEATADDLTLSTWRSFESWLAAKGYSPRYQLQSRLHLRMAWRRALEKQLTSVPLPPKRHRDQPLDLGPLPERAVQGFYDRYYFPVRLRARADNTDRLYRFSIRNLSRFLGRHATLDDFTDETVAAMLVWMAGRDKSPYSCEKERSQLLAIWRAAHRKALVTNWPDVQAERLPLRTPAAWMTDDLPKLFAAVKNAPGEIGGVPAGDWMTALHWVLLYSAERIGAVLALEWPDFDGGTGWTTFRAETRKGGREDNSVRLPAAAIAAVERIRKPARKQIFPLDCTMSDLYYFYGKVLKEAGLPHDGKSKFHRMRKTAASHFEAKGGNATALLRHANRKTTLAYLDPRIVTPPQAADLLTGLVASGA